MRFQVITLMLTALLLFSCSGKQDSNNNAVLPTIPVKTKMTELGSIHITRQFSGGLLGTEQADISIRLSEAVTALPFAEGDLVRQGDVIIRLDRGGASSNYYQTRAAFENARKAFQKMQFLYSEGAVSESDYDNAQANFDVAKANFDAAGEMVEITSPISGRIVELNVKVGDVPQVGTLAARIARTDSLRLSFGVPANAFDHFQVGMPGELTVPTYPQLFPCMVTEVARAADPATRTFAVDVTVPNSEGRLQPGMFAEVTFVIDSRDSVIAIDRNALLSTEGLYEVFVVKNDTAYARSVSIGIANQKNTEIRAGLDVGEEVVVLGQSFLSDGYPVLRSREAGSDSL